MDATEQISRFNSFFETYYRDQLLEAARKGHNFLPVDFSHLIEFDPDLAHHLLDEPEDGGKAAELAMEQIVEQKFIARFVNLPDNAKIMIRNIRSVDLNRFKKIEGVIRNKTEVRPQVTQARFECPSCGNVLSVLQMDTKFKEPTRCSCGRKGKFRMLEKELCDAQGVILEEIPEQLDGGAQPKRLNIFLKNDLCSPLSERKANPGARIIVSGVIKEVPVILRSGAQSTRFDIMLEANSVEGIQEDFTDITISEEEEQEIQKLSKDPKIIRHMVQSMVPSIFGHEKIKEALLLQMMGGVRKQRKDGIVTRGDIHILLCGDPGCGKSQMIKRIEKVAPKARYVTGKGASGTGLSATVVKDEFLQGWSLEAGALVLANKGVCCIDELDKMSTEDAWSMHEALEQQQITISKANIQASLRCETTVLAAANPKWGRFDPYDTVANQINLPPTLINRFDLIFPVKDLPELKHDERMAGFILRMHKEDAQDPTIETQLLRKYISYARQKCFPKLTDQAISVLQEYYIKMRSSAGGSRSIPISARQLEGLVRLSEASAKIHLRHEVLKEDAERAVELVDYCLRQVAFDEKTGTIDIDRIATDTPASSRNKIVMLKETLVELEGEHGKTVPIEELVNRCIEKGMAESEVEELITKLKRSGDIFEPRKGFLSRI